MQWMLSMKRGVVLFSFLFGEKTEKTALNWCHSFSSWNSSLSWDQLGQGFFCSQTDTKLSWDQCLGLCWREAGGNGSYQNSGRCMCSWVSCGLVSGSGTLHTFAHVHDSMHAHTCTCEADTHTHTDCRHPPSPSSCPWAWQSGHGRYQRVGEAWKHRLRLWVRSVCSCESAFVGDKMAMSEQLESEGGKSVLLTFSFLPFSQLTR